MANTTIQQSDRGNCTIIEPVTNINPFSNISRVTSRRKKKETTANSIFTQDDIEEILEVLSETQNSRNATKFTDLTDITTAFIASSIEINIMNSSKYSCELCEVVFQENDKVHDAFTSEHHTRKACISTFEICRTADYFLKLEILNGQFSFELIRQAILCSLNIGSLYTKSSFSAHLHPKSDLIEVILTEFIRYKGNYLAKSVSYDEFQKNIRRKLHRLIINQNQ